MRLSLLMAALVLLASQACRPPSGDGDGDSDSDADSDGDVDSGPVDCTPGQLGCSGTIPRLCNESGDGWENFPECTEPTPTCVPDVGCATCLPRSSDCDGNVPRSCSADGTVWERGEPCNTDAGEICQFGACMDPCRVAAEANSYVGCEYWAVDLPNAQQESSFNPRDAQFSVVVSNGNESATARVEVFAFGDETTAILAADVPPNDLRVLEINPTVPPAQSNVEGTGVHADRAFHIVSNVPVTAYQFNPLNNTDAAYSNDASLLLPVTGLDRDYIAATGDALIGSDSDSPTVTYNWGAYIAVVGIEDNTEVTITPTAEINGGGGIDGGTGEIRQTIGRFDVLNVESRATESGATRTSGHGNLSGSRVSASAPVAVFAGNVATIMPYGPDGQCCADHLEEQLIPLSSWGQNFVVGRGLPRRVAHDPEFEYYRITGGNVPAGQDAIHLTYHPAPPEGAPGQLTEGQSVEFRSLTDFIVTADGPILVTSYFVSSFITAPGATGAEICFTDAECAGLNWAAVCVPGGFMGNVCAPIGDPSMTIIPPVEQFRDSYVFLAPNDYAHDAITVIAPLDAVMFLDGAPVAAPAAVGDVNGITYGVVRQQVPDGTHRLSVEGGVEVGLIVYGMDKDVSYGYPAGLDLEAINPII